MFRSSRARAVIPSNRLRSHRVCCGVKTTLMVAKLLVRCRWVRTARTVPVFLATRPSRGQTCRGRRRRSGRPRSRMTRAKPLAVMMSSAHLRLAGREGGRTQRTFRRSAPAARRDSGYRASGRSTMAEVSPRRVVFASSAQANAVPPAEGMLTISLRRPRGNPPPNMASKASMPVVRRRTDSATEPNRTFPGRSRGRGKADDMRTHFR